MTKLVTYERILKNALSNEQWTFAAIIAERIEALKAANDPLEEALKAVEQMQ